MEFCNITPRAGSFAMAARCTLELDVANATWCWWHIEVKKITLVYTWGMSRGHVFSSTSPPSPRSVRLRCLFFTIEFRLGSPELEPNLFLELRLLLRVQDLKVSPIRLLASGTGLQLRTHDGKQG